MTEDVLAFIDQHGLKEPTLIGHSMYALAFARPLEILQSADVMIGEPRRPCLLPSVHQKRFQGLSQLTMPLPTPRSVEPLLPMFEG